MLSPREPPKNWRPSGPGRKKPSPSKGSSPSGTKCVGSTSDAEELLKRLGVPEDGWDFLIVGDGSGSNWEIGAGWASVSVERETGERRVWYGAMNRGTVNFGEIMAYLQPLGWLSSREDGRRTGGARTRAYRVHIVTDSEYCKTMGKSGRRGNIKNAALWAAFDVFKRQGFVLFWHWLRRDECELNRYSDKLSKMARTLFKKYNLQEEAGPP